MGRDTMTGGSVRWRDRGGGQDGRDKVPRHSTGLVSMAACGCVTPGSSAQDHRSRPQGDFQRCVCCDCVPGTPYSQSLNVGLPWCSLDAVPPISKPRLPSSGGLDLFWGGSQAVVNSRQGEGGSMERV